METPLVKVGGAYHHPAVVDQHHLGMEYRSLPFEDLYPPLEERCIVAPADEPDERHIVFGGKYQLHPDPPGSGAQKGADHPRSRYEIWIHDLDALRGPGNGHAEGAADQGAVVMRAAVDNQHFGI